MQLFCREYKYDETNLCILYHSTCETPTHLMMVDFDVADVAVLQQCMKTEGVVHFSLLQ